MNKTVTISAFAGILSRQSGYTAEFCERFVAEMFKTAAEGLKESNEVTIKGLGAFASDENGNVSFAADNTFAAEVNAPFDCFEPEILDDEVTDELLSDGMIADEQETGNDTPEDVIKEEVTEEAPEEKINLLEDKIDELEDKIERLEEVIDDKENEIDEKTADKTDDEIDEIESRIDDEIDDIEKEIDEIEDEIDRLNDEVDDMRDDIDNADEETSETEIRKRKGIWSFVCGMAAGAVIGAAVTYFLAVTPVKQSAQQEQTETKIVAEELGATNGEGVDDTQASGVADSGNAAAMSDNAADNVATGGDASNGQSGNQSDKTKGADEAPVYDTVTNTLSQLSRKHYGSYHFWVYIYDENRDIISDPDKVEPGTRVRIPSPEKYGIDYKNKESVNNALRRAQEIARESK